MNSSKLPPKAPSKQKVVVMMIAIFVLSMLVGIGTHYMEHGTVDVTTMLFSSIVIGILIAVSAVIGYKKRKTIQKAQQSGQWAVWQIFIGVGMLVLITLRSLISDTSSVSIYLHIFGGLFFLIGGVMYFWKKKK
ncbi:MAG: hypothetical protein ACK4NC_05745 [Candidatus Gracilibacteria bacterium]